MARLLAGRQWLRPGLIEARALARLPTRLIARLIAGLRREPLLSLRTLFLLQGLASGSPFLLRPEGLLPWLAGLTGLPSTRQIFGPAGGRLAALFALLWGRRAFGQTSRFAPGRSLGSARVALGQAGRLLPRATLKIAVSDGALRQGALQRPTIFRPLLLHLLVQIALHLLTLLDELMQLLSALAKLIALLRGYAFQAERQLLDPRDVRQGSR